MSRTRSTHPFASSRRLAVGLVAALLSVAAPACLADGSAASKVGPDRTIPPTSPLPDSFAITPARSAPLDRFGGSTARTFPATGRFRTQQIDGRWWLIDPDGHPFFSNGIGAVRYEEPPSNQTRWPTEAAWAAATRQRLADWKVNTVGSWSETYLPTLATGKVPYTYVVETTDRPDDIFSPVWEQKVHDRIGEAVERHGDDPYLIGYFMDNELPWLIDLKDNFASLLIAYLRLPPTAPGKTEVVAFLKARYQGDIGALRRDMSSVTAQSWAELARTTGPFSAPEAQAGRDTQEAWTVHVAERYFAYVGGALEEADPTHLNLGPRVVSQITPRSVVEIAGPHVDVFALNFYQQLPEWDAAAKGFGGGFDMMWTADTLAEFHEVSEKPLLIGEWGYRAADSGLPNTIPPAMVTARDQRQRAQWATNYLSCVINTDYIVGAHWFQMADQPLGGRGGDGENNNWGLVAWEREHVYTEVTDVLAKVLGWAYDRLDGGHDPLPCKPVGVQD